VPLPQHVRRCDGQCLGDGFLRRRRQGGTWCVARISRARSLARRGHVLLPLGHPGVIAAAVDHLGPPLATSVAQVDSSARNPPPACPVDRFSGQAALADSHTTHHTTHIADDLVAITTISVTRSCRTRCSATSCTGCSGSGTRSWTVTGRLDAGLGIDDLAVGGARCPPYRQTVPPCQFAPGGHAGRPFWGAKLTMADFHGPTPPCSSRTGRASPPHQLGQDQAHRHSALPGPAPQARVTGPPRRCSRRRIGHRMPLFRAE